jgi:hypothetical protein
MRSAARRSRAGYVTCRLMRMPHAFGVKKNNNKQKGFLVLFISWWRGEMAMWKLARLRRLPRHQSSSHCSSSRLLLPPDPHPFFLHRGQAKKLPARRGVISANNRRPSASSFGPNCGGFPALLKSSAPCCPESREYLARRSNVPQVGSGQKQCKVLRGQIIPPAHVKIFKKSYQLHRFRRSLIYFSNSF